MKSVYLDNAATTKVDPEVFSAMKLFFTKHFGNPSEYHKLGRKARDEIELSRKYIALYLGAKCKEIIFTSCATESVNLAHKGLVEALRPTSLAQDKPHIITSSIEHKAVLESCKHLEKMGCSVTFLGVDKYGVINFQDIKKAIGTNTVLVSIMYVNNEVGTIQPIGRIGEYLRILNKERRQKIYLHTDATQAISYLDCKVNRLGVDLLSFTGHKINAPKGIGVLYVREKTPLIRQMDGGGQEGNLRSGTENVPYIVGLRKAIEVNQKSKVISQKLITLRDRLIQGVLKIPGVKLTGHPQKRAFHIASFIVDAVEGEAMVLRLSDLGIYASSGSACTAGDLKPSHVLTAMGFSPEQSHGSIRFSLSKDTKEKDVNYLLEIFPKIVGDLRKMAPKI